MRILAIELKNLNSLMGQWRIDLSDSAYTTDGLFAITGPTGAGKSTLLDAICLALYGQTPRLGKLSKNNNEILSRHCVECFAEVTFETVTGRWRCRWSQHRSRKKASGALQEPKHELVRADTGEILEDKTHGVTEHVERITGMDFKRFTRAMLLAQGGFASFLQSKPDERSPLLEQITGTAIYSDISKRVFERQRDAQQQRQLLQAGLQGLTLMEQDELQSQEAALCELSSQAQALNKQLGHMAQALGWHARVRQLTQHKADLKERSAQLSHQHSAFAPQLARLQTALQAQEWAPAHQRLQGLRVQRQTDYQAWQTLQEQLPQLEAACARSQAQELQALQQEQAAQAEWQTAQPQLRQAREWDWQISKEQLQLRELTQTLQHLEAQHQDHTLQQHKGQQQQTQHLQTIEQLQGEQMRHAEDAQLVENLSALQERLRQLAQQQTAQAQSQQALQQAQEQASQAKQRWSQATQAEHKQHQAWQQNQAALVAAQQQFQGLLEHHSLHQWHEQHAARLAQQHALQHTLDSLDQWQQRAQQHQGMQAHLQQLAEQRSAAEQALQALAADMEPQERELLLVQRQLELEIRIQSLEAHRHSLVEDAPCPLCGSEQHPYAHQAPAGSAANTRQEIEQREAALQLLRQQRDALRIELAQAHKAWDITHTELHKLQQALAGLEAQYQAAWQACTQERLTASAQQTMQHALSLQTALTSNTASAHAEALRQALQTGQAALARSQQTVAQAVQLEARIAHLQQAHEQAHSRWQQAQRETQAQQFRSEQHQANLATLHTAANQYASQTQALQQALQSELAIFDLHEWTAEQAMQTLSERRSRWLARLSALAHCQSELAVLAQALQQRQATLQGLEQQRQTLQAQHLHSTQQLQSLQAQRQQLLPEQTPDAMESQLQTQLHSAQQALEQARAQHSQAKQHAANALARSHDLQQRLSALEASLSQQHTAFLALLQQHQFDDEAAFEAALLPQHERAQLASQAKALEQQHTALQAQQAACAEQLAELQAQPPTELSEEALQAQQSLEQEALDSLQSRIAATKHRLEVHAQMQVQQASQLQALEAQTKECQRWDHLHALIGSADGKKFRNFAQGLTFELMVQQANQQLRSLSERYLLIRDHTEPLALNVIDTYQNAEVRSTKTLSGGESFLVSLALALGLSRMASQNVRIDSLFLDEGFGTLDEEALETALETLASLQHEGKLIGVISHVSALKERIATQIQVVPLSGGRSGLRGPGCSLQIPPSG